MKGKLVVAMVLGAAFSMAPSARAYTYSDSDFSGTYAEKFSGYFSGVASPIVAGTSEPQSGAGFVTADGNGNFYGALAFSIGGSTCVGDISGTYQVFAAGTGTSTATFTPQSTGVPGMPTGNYACPSQMTGTQDEAFIIVSPTEIDFISTDADSVVTGTAQLQVQSSGSATTSSAKQSTKQK
jgi:hypothetical protein